MAPTVAGDDGSRQVSKLELSMARFQGRYAAEVVKKLSS